MQISEANEKIYGESLTAAYYEFSKDRLNKTLAFVGDVKGKMLDVGCGNGEFTESFKIPGREIFGIDIVKKNVESAKAKGINAQVCNLSSEKLPFKDKEFNIVLCSEVIEHIYDTEEFARELRRVLKDDGKLIISVPNIACWYNRGLLFLGHVPCYVESGSTKSFGTLFDTGVTGHVKAFTKQSLIELLEDADFKIEKVTGSKVNLAPHCTKKRHFAGNTVFQLLESFFCLSPSFASNVIIRASKK